LYSTPNIITVIILRIRWVWHLARMEKIINTYKKIQSENLK